MSWTKLAVIGDSVAEGVREPAPGYEDLSWVDRVARELRLDTLNLGLRYLRAAEVRETQLEPALGFGPDLAFVTCGANDAFRREFDTAAVAAELELMIGSFREAGADVVTLGLFDNPEATAFARRAAARLRELSALTEKISTRHGAFHVDFGDHPACPDQSIYSSDNLHLNAKGHAIVADAVVRVLRAGR
ncbi:MAG: SGNH/GDSL hydrolase family protein [Streptosporangiaceae bacterium]